MAKGEFEHAVAVLEKSLERFPNNIYALYALQKAQIAIGDDDAASETERHPGQASIPTLGRLALERI